MSSKGVGEPSRAEAIHRPSGLDTMALVPVASNHPPPPVPTRVVVEAAPLLPPIPIPKGDVTLLILLLPLSDKYRVPLESMARPEIEVENKAEVPIKESLKPLLPTDDPARRPRTQDPRGAEVEGLGLGVGVLV